MGVTKQDISSGRWRHGRGGGVRGQWGSLQHGEAQAKNWSIMEDQDKQVQEGKNV